MLLAFVLVIHVRIQRGGQGVRTPLKNHKNIGFSSNIGLDPLKNGSYQASIQCWAITGPPAKRHLMVFCWRAEDGPLIVVLGSSLPSSTKKKKKKKKKNHCQSWTPSDKTFWIRSCDNLPVQTHKPYNNFCLFTSQIKNCPLLWFSDPITETPQAKMVKSKYDINILYSPTFLASSIRTLLQVTWHAVCYNISGHYYITTLFLHAIRIDKPCHVITIVFVILSHRFRSTKF